MSIQTLLSKTNSYVAKVYLDIIENEISKLRSLTVFTTITKGYRDTRMLTFRVYVRIKMKCVQVRLCYLWGDYNDFTSMRLLCDLYYGFNVKNQGRSLYSHA